MEDLDNSRITLVNIVKSFEINNSFIEKILTDEISIFDDEEMERFNQCEIMLTEFLETIDFVKTDIFKTGIKSASSLSFATGGEQLSADQYEYSIVLLVLFLWDDIVSEYKDVSNEPASVLAEYFSSLVTENITVAPTNSSLPEGDILSLAKLVIHINETHVGLLQNCNMDRFLIGGNDGIVEDVPNNLDEYWYVREMCCYRGVLNCLKYLLDRQGIQSSFDNELYKICGQFICIIKDFASYEKDIAAGSSFNSIIISEKTNNNGKELVANYLYTIAQDYKNQIAEFDNESSMVMLSWVLGYCRFKKYEEE